MILCVRMYGKLASIHICMVFLFFAKFFFFSSSSIVATLSPHSIYFRNGMDGDVCVANEVLNSVMIFQCCMCGRNDLRLPIFRPLFFSICVAIACCSCCCCVSYVYRNKFDADSLNTPHNLYWASFFFFGSLSSYGLCSYSFLVFLSFGLPLYIYFGACCLLYGCSCIFFF